MRPTSVETFWWWIQEREAIRLRRAAGQPWPWTDDEILRDYRFCCVYRRDDAGTQWYLRNVVPQSDGFQDLVWRTVLYRMVNSSSWFEKIGGVFGRDSWGANSSLFLERMQEAGLPYNDAYLILGGCLKKMSRFQYLASHLDRNTQILPEIMGAIAVEPSLERVWKLLQKFSGIGPFIAMQVYEDLFLAGELSWLDQNSFVYIGPGAVPAISLLLGLDSKRRGYGHSLEAFSVANYREGLHFLRTELWEKQPGPPVPHVPLIGDIQGALCETRKFWNIQAWLAGQGKRPKLRRYPAPLVGGDPNVRDLPVHGLAPDATSRALSP